MKRIVIISDCSDVAYNELRGIILKTLSEIRDTDDIIIEPLAPVKPFSIINGAFVLRLMAEAYPIHTTFLIIVNPLQKRPERIFGKTKKGDFIFMGANTGIFDWFLKDFGIKELFELNDPGFFPFGGKYVHAPNVAKLTAGTPSRELGKPFDEGNLAKLNMEDGAIVHIDNFGLIKFIGTIPPAKEGDYFKITVNNKKIIAVYARRMMNYETSQWILYPGSSLQLPELGKVRSNGAQELKLEIGDRILFEKV